MALVAYETGEEVFDRIVLATGNNLPQTLAWFPERLKGHHGLHPHPWVESISTIAQGDAVIVGSGFRGADYCRLLT